MSDPKQMRSMADNEEIEFYVTKATEAGEAIKKVIDQKAGALAARDFHEVYRLAGIITLLVRDAEDIDRQMFERHSDNATIEEEEY